MFFATLDKIEHLAIDVPKRFVGLHPSGSKVGASASIIKQLKPPFIRDDVLSIVIYCRNPTDITMTTSIMDLAMENYQCVICSNQPSNLGG